MRPIDADALMKRIEDSARNAGLHQEDYCKIKRFITKAPTVDAVEVVRCKDCAHAGAFPNAYSARRFEGCLNCYLCRGDDGFGVANVSVVHPDDYCSDGVRRT